MEKKLRFFVIIFSTSDTCDPLEGRSIHTYHWPCSSCTSLALQPPTCLHIWFLTLCTNSNIHPKMPHWSILRRVGIECVFLPPSTWALLFLGYLSVMPNLLCCHHSMQLIQLFLYLQASDLPLTPCISHRHHMKTSWKIVHNNQCRSFNFSTWMHLQIVFNSRIILYEYNIFVFYDLFNLQTYEPVGLSSLTITQKPTFCIFCIMLILLFIQHFYVGNASKHIHVCNARPLPTLRLLDVMEFNALIEH